MAQKHQFSSNQRMAHTILAASANPSTLEGFLSDRFARGYSYEQIAKELHSETEGAVSVSYATVKRWLADFGLSPSQRKAAS